MARMKRLVEKNEEVVVVRIPVTTSEIADRVKQYDLLDPSKFSKRYNDLLYGSVSFFLNEKEHIIQYNFCEIRLLMARSPTRKIHKRKRKSEQLST
ncbi:hypothetical protein AB3U99_16655 [Niallia sp. JL1B1071]|uniref:hypothetical protein n=1 Tax=Niallia tiangongensis TaxID=3237105 RepID=UPI0037DDD773